MLVWERWDEWVSVCLYVYVCFSVYVYVCGGGVGGGKGERGGDSFKVPSEMAD